MNLIIGAGLLWALIYFLARELPGSRLYNLSPRGAVLLFIVSGGGGLLVRQCKERRRADRFQERMLELQRRAGVLRAGDEAGRETERETGRDAERDAERDAGRDAGRDAERDAGAEQEREPSGDHAEEWR